MSGHDEFLSQLSAGYARLSLTRGEKLILAVSGGADSMALLHGTVELWGDDAHLVVVHVNHGFRGAESDEDAKFVQDAAQGLSLRCELVAPDGAQDDLRETEESARTVRYHNLMDMAQKHEIGLIATAHHANDQAETVLHNIIRGTGLQGVCGMQPSRLLDDGVRLIRPMLSLRKWDVEAFLRKRRVEFRTDRTNEEQRFTRNRIRHQVLPMLEREVNTNAVDKLQQLAGQAAEAVEALDEIGDRLVDDAMIERSRTLCRMDVTLLVAASPFILRHGLLRLWSRQRWPRQKMAQKHWKRLEMLIREDQDSREQFPGLVEFTKSRSLVRLVRHSPLE